MLRDITIGQYYNISSPVHSLDPRTKIISLAVLMVLIFMLRGFVEYLLMAAVVIGIIVASRIPLSFVMKGMKPVWLLVVFTAIINLFMGGGENVIFQWSWVKITEESLYLSLSMMARIVLLVVMSSLLTYTTSPTALTGGIERLLKPLEKIKFPSHEIAMMMSIALRFIPTLSEEADKIMKAQASRGNDFESGSIVKRSMAMVPLLVPLFISAFRRADELAMAMECRCYRGGGNRTAFRVLKYSKKDAAAFIFLGLIAAAFVIGGMI